MKPSEIQVDHTYSRGDVTRKVIKISKQLTEELWVFYLERGSFNTGHFWMSLERFLDWAKEEVNDETASNQCRPENHK